MTAWVKTNREIAKLLGIKLLKQRNRLRGQLSEINGWRARADFPAYQKGKGYPAAEVLQWAERFAAEIAPVKQRRAAVAQILSEEQPAKGAIKILGERSGLAGTADDGAARQHRPTGNDGPIPSQAAMAVELQERYGFPIKRQAIQRWIHGIHLPAGAPRFPAPDPGRAGWNNPQPCYEWYERWVVGPVRAAEKGNGAPMQMDLIGQKAADAQVAEFDKAIESAAIEKLKREALEREISEKWILREQATSTAIQAIRDVLRIVEMEYERNAPGRRRERLAALVAGVRSQKLGDRSQESEVSNSSFELLVSSFFAFDCEDERGRFDRIKLACAAQAEAVGSMTGTV